MAVETEAKPRLITTSEARARATRRAVETAAAIGSTADAEFPGDGAARKRFLTETARQLLACAKDVA
jgi:hypothetical protein